MADYLLDLSMNPLAKRLVRQLKLPIPLPEPLRRAKGPLAAEPLSGQRVLLGTSASQSPFTALLAKLCTDAGATVSAELAAPSAEVRSDILLFDASAARSPAELDALYDFMRPRLASLNACGRVLVIGAGAGALDPIASACAQALVGFTKSLAKELGRRGATAQALFVDPKAHDARWLATPLAYLLGRRSAFVSGQALELALPAAPDASPQIMPRTQVLKGKIALVTGAAHGIGAAICQTLALEGAKVVCLDRPSEEAATEAVARAADGVVYGFDLLDPDAPRKIAQRLSTDFGAIDVVVHNAGITRDKTLARMTPEWWRDVLAINLQAPLALTTLLTGKEKLLNSGGRLIYLSSIGGIAGNAGQTNYAAAKAGLMGYVRALAPELAPRGITVNAVAPGFIDTRMTRAMPAGVREVARRFNALSQAGEPADVAAAACFLAEPGAAAITGQTLRVCGQNLIGA